LESRKSISIKREVFQLTFFFEKKKVSKEKPVFKIALTPRQTVGNARGHFQKRKYAKKKRCSIPRLPIGKPLGTPAVIFRKESMQRKSGVQNRTALKMENAPEGAFL
jgi:hypothetical protein